MSKFDGTAPDFAPEYTPRRRVSNYRVEVQTSDAGDPNTVLDELKSRVQLPLAGSGLGPQRTCFIIFRAADDETALAEVHDNLAYTLQSPLVAASVVSTGHGVNYCELDH